MKACSYIFLQIFSRIIFFFFICNLSCREEYTTTGENLQYRNLIENIKEEEPFSALGFFNVDKTSVTALLGTIITYNIILVQFNLC